MNSSPDFFSSRSNAAIPLINLSNTPCKLPPLSKHLNCTWSSTLTNTAKVLSLLRNKPRDSGQSRARPEHVISGDVGWDATFSELCVSSEDPDMSLYSPWNSPKRGNKQTIKEQQWKKVSNTMPWKSYELHLDRVVECKSLVSQVEKERSD